MIQTYYTDNYKLSNKNSTKIEGQTPPEERNETVHIMT